MITLLARNSVGGQHSERELDRRYILVGCVSALSGWSVQDRFALPCARGSRVLVADI